MAMAHNLLLLIDGMAMAYRSFYGIRDLATKDGTPTNALFGFIRAVQMYDERFKPSHRAVVFDGGLPEERMALLPDYKAQRKPMPDPLRAQLEPINDFLACYNCPVLREDRQEADDLLASLTARGREEGMDVYIATGDKDMFQLVDDHVHIILPGKDGRVMDAAAIQEKTGVRPDQIVDWLALVGDQSDNIPGVPGVGGKTAAKWLGEYGTLDGVLDHIDHLKPERLAAALHAARDRVERNVKLTRLRCDLDVHRGWDALTIRQPDYQALIAFSQQYELQSLTSSFKKQLQPDLFM
ncbi:MAG: 5'-3' exonuclease [Spartobacteria bacterium]|nr:5'-3' exonuclease [Spartobacteria bacterium]